jgi:uncharacterized membrane protein
MSDASEGDRSSSGHPPTGATPPTNPTAPLPMLEGPAAGIGGYLDRLLPAAGGRVDRVSQHVHNAVRWAGDTPPGRLIMPLLRGNAWLGHPAHPVVVTVPIGAWVVSSWYDLRSIRTGRKRDEYAADGALRIGIVSAVPAAVTGIAQFLDTRDHTRRETAVHAALNNLALTLFLLSLGLRGAGHRGLARGVSATALAVVGVSGYLGGDLAYRHGIGVDTPI